MTEEDVRQKLVCEWLLDHGFGPRDFDIEFAFELRWGHTAAFVGGTVPSVSRPRADCVVRTSDGHNLMVIEVKAPGVPLDENSKEQGISYARLLRAGGIAPFVVLTNGRDSAIYDTVTEERIDGCRVPTDHPAVKAGYRIGVEDLGLRAQALETLVSLTPENLVSFCSEQVVSRMAPLADSDLSKGFKYVPSLYVSRREVEKEIDKLLLEHRPVVLLHGPPQVGKTNVLCHLATARVADGKPALFYSAASMSGGLISEITEDFEWSFGDTSAPSAIVRSKISAVLQRTGTNLVVYVDGWNEAALGLARAIDADGGRLANGRIQVVISATETAVERLLLDGADNPSRLAQAVGLSARDVRELATFPEVPPRQRAIVRVTGFGGPELEEAYARYAAAFEVSVPDHHQRESDPFLLRAAMEEHSSGELPQRLDQPRLLRGRLQRKACRSRDFDAATVEALMDDLAEMVYHRGAPVPRRLLIEKWGGRAEEALRVLSEAALVALVRTEEGVPAVDFYYSRERDYVVAYRARGWQHNLDASTTIAKVERELDHAVSVPAADQALRWFLAMPQHYAICRRLLNEWEHFESANAQFAAIRALGDALERGHGKDFDEKAVETVVMRALGNGDRRVVVEAVRSVAFSSGEDDDLFASHFDNVEDDLELARTLFELIGRDDDSDLPYLVKRGVVRAFREWGYTAGSDLEYGNDWTNGGQDIFWTVLNDPSAPPSVLYGAAVVLGSASPHCLLSYLHKRWESGRAPLPGPIVESALEEAREGLGEGYYGGMCPGFLDGAEVETLAAEFERVGPLIETALGQCSDPKLVEWYQSLYESLCPPGCSVAVASGISLLDTDPHSIEILRRLARENPNQLDLFIPKGGACRHP